MAEFVMPSLGADMEAGTLCAWVRKPGERVERGDIIAEVDTDKGVIEVEVFTGGVIERLLVEEGKKVPVGTPLAVIREDGAAAEEAPPPAKPDAPPAKAPEPARLRMSPSARRLARELGVDVAKVRGTGPGGAVTRTDIEAAGRPAAAPSPPAPAVRPRPAAGPSPDAATRMRRAVAAAMSRSNREIPHYYLSHTVDLSATLDWLDERNAERPVTERLLLGAVLLKAAALALRDFPELNGRWEGDELLRVEPIHLGTAVSLRGGGLVIPAVHHTDRQELDGLMEKLRDLVERARRGQLRSSELADGTLTVTSLGERGVQTVYGVIYPPQVALVGFGKPMVRPWVVAGRVEPRPLLEVTLAADHRASDGHRGALFLAGIERRLLAPETL